MAGWWNDEGGRDDERKSEGRERGRDWRSDYGRDTDRERFAGAQERSFGRQDRVFGEDDYGAEYNKPADERWERGGRGAEGRSTTGASDTSRGGDWQGRDFGGVSPAMRRGDYESGYRGASETRGSSVRNPGQAQGGQDYRQGGRFYGDDDKYRIYREEFGMGGREYGSVPRGWDENVRGRDGDRSARDVESRYARDMQRPASGGTGGYDYERGYGDGGRDTQGYAMPMPNDYGRYEQGGRQARNPAQAYGPDREPVREGFEERAHEAGEGLRRMGQKISNWFGEMGGDRARGYDPGRDGASGAYGETQPTPYRGRGPKGYVRSDERISDEAHQRLTDDPWIDASEISISVSGGELTLSGTVDNRESKHRAERIVEDLSGVRHVQNNLRIQQGNFFTSPGRGYGDSVLEAKMQSDDPNAGSTGEDSAATRTTTRRT